MAESRSLQALYAELKDHVAADSLGDIVKVCDEILRDNPEEEPAKRCKIVALIHDSKYDDALKTINQYKTSMPVEKAYCLYRLQDPAGAQAVLKNASEDSPAKQLLHAQISYRLGAFDKSAKVYQNLLNEGCRVVDTDELATNTCAAFLNAGNPREALEATESRNYGENGGMYDLAFNRACALAEDRQLGNAAAQLDVAEKLCHAMFAHDEDSETAIADELVAVRIERAYLQHLQGDLQSALTVYNDLLRMKVSDLSMRAVASNNAMAAKAEKDISRASRLLQDKTDREAAAASQRPGAGGDSEAVKEENSAAPGKAAKAQKGSGPKKMDAAKLAGIAVPNLVDAAKKLKPAAEKECEVKLTARQKTELFFNMSLLDIFRKKTLGETVEMEKQGLPKEMCAVLCAFNHFWNNRVERCESTLKEYIDSTEDASSRQRMQLVLAQLYCLLGGLHASSHTRGKGAAPAAATAVPAQTSRTHIQAAIAILESMKELEDTPGMVSALVALYERCGDVDGAMAVFDATISRRQNSMDDDGAGESVVCVLRRAAAFKQTHGRFEEAASDWERVLSLCPGDVSAVASRVICLAKFDLKAANELASSLPSLGGAAKMDPEKLDMISLQALASAQSRKRGATSAPAQQSEEPARKKKKRKPRLPKNYDPNEQPDPERWLPRRERAAARKGRRRREMLKGPQGSTVAGTTQKKTVGDAEVGGASESRSTAQTSKAPSRPATARKQKRRKK